MTLSPRRASLWPGESPNGALRFFKFGSDDQAHFKAVVAETADGYFDIGASDYAIKPQDTE